MNDNTDTRLEVRRAELLGRQFNAALMNATAYGVEHGVCQRAVETLLETLEKTRAECESVTLLLDRGTLFIEDHSLQGKLNPTRMMRVFRTLGLQSITIRRGVDTQAIGVLLGMLETPDEVGDVATMKERLAQAGVHTIQVNHVVMRKITADDEVIAREGLEQLAEMAERNASGARSAGESGQGPAPERSLPERLEELFSLRTLLEFPEQIADQVVARTWSDQGEQVGGRLRELRERLARPVPNEDPEVSPARIHEAVQRLRAELKEALAGQEELARFMAEHGSAVVDEIEQLSFDTVMMIVREEYLSGVSLNRLAQVITRVVPERSELVRMLPVLKRGLVEAGMPLADYVQLVHELGDELQDKSLRAALEEGAGALGLSTDDLVAEIRRDPFEAARLLVLASELRGTGDERSLSAVLGEYLTSAGQSLLDGDEQQLSDEEVKRALRQAQQRLLDNAKQQGLNSTQVGRLVEELDGQLDQSLDEIRIRRVVARLERSPVRDEKALSDVLRSVFGGGRELHRLADRLAATLEPLGYDADQLQRVFEKTERALQSRNRLDLLPDGMLEPKVINYLLEREIAASRRFGTYFSVLLLMVARIRLDGGSGPAAWRPASPEEVDVLLPQLFRALPPHVRDIDLLGSLGDRERHIPLVLLTMAHDDGAEIVRKRMLRELGDERFELDGQPVQIDLAAVARRFDAERTPDRISFLNALQAELASELLRRLHAPD